MSATIEIFRRFLARSGDQTLIDHGSITAAQDPTSTDGDAVARPRTVTLAAGESFTLWEWATDGDLTAMIIESSGFLWLEQYVDLPTDAGAEDYTPVGGTSVNHPKDALSCIGPRIIEGMAVPTVPSSTNYAGSAFHATTANGRRYRITVKNPSDATAAVTVTWAWIH